MPEEVGGFLTELSNIEQKSFGDLIIYSGRYNKDDLIISIAFSGWGKVSAARATTRLINFKSGNKKVEFIFFTGVAGSATPKLKQWDLIIGDSLIQHDMDASPMFDKLVIPSLNTKELIPDKFIVNKIFKELNIQKDSILSPIFGSIFRGKIASGDQFINNQNKLNKIRSIVPDLSALEMEGAAFAQVAIQEGIQWIVVRVISDNASTDSENEFTKFVEKYNFHSQKLIEALIKIIIN